MTDSTASAHSDRDGLDGRVAAGEAPRLVAKGFLIGSADIVPGVSGGTVALLVGIYVRLLAALRSFDRRWLQLLLTGRVIEAMRRPHFAFLALVGGGVIAAVLFFTRVVGLPHLVVTHATYLYALFFGLIAASIVLFVRHLGRATPWRLLLLAASAIGAWLAVGAVPADTPDDVWFIVLCGMIASSAMLLPGISGSYVLLVLKKYAFITAAIGAFDLAVIAPFALGIVAGVVTFSRVFGTLLARFETPTLYAITGLLIGALKALWPYQSRVVEVAATGGARLVGTTPYLPDRLDGQALAVVGLMLVGVGAVVLLHKLTGGKRG